jgi:hypothetical protein
MRTMWIRLRWQPNIPPDHKRALRMVVMTERPVLLSPVLAHLKSPEAPIPTDDHRELPTNANGSLMLESPLTETAVWHLCKRQKTADPNTTIERWTESTYGWWKNPFRIYNVWFSQDFLLFGPSIFILCTCLAILYLPLHFALFIPMFIVLYDVGWVVLLFPAFMSLWSPSPEAYPTVYWTNFIPHV